MPISTFLDGRPPTRGLLWLALSATGRVLVRSSISDGGGGQTETYTPGPDVSCRIDALGGGEGEISDRISDRSTHIVTLPANTSVVLEDDFELDGVGRFEITAIRDHTGDFARMVEVTDRRTS